MAHCVNCGAVLSEGAMFCGSCGSKVTVVEEAVASAPTSTLNDAVSNLQAKVHVTPESKFDAGFIEIRNHAFRWGANVVALDHLERVTTVTPQPAFPKLALLVLVVGIICCLLLPPAGIILIIAAIAWVGYWLYQKFNTKKGVVLFLDSGTRLSFLFNDHAFADSVVNAFFEAMNDASVELRFELPRGLTTKVTEPASGFMK